MDLGLQGRTALVTGGSGGIGSEIVRQFAAEGANVVIQYRNNKAAAARLVEEIGSASCLAVAGDMSNEANVGEVFDEAVQRFAKLDVLVCCAGVWPPEPVSISAMPVSQWQSTLETNLASTFLCCREFLRRVEKAPFEDPSIVLIGSTAGVFGEAGHADYAASKSALSAGLMYSLKNEIVRIARRGRVNTVSPGWTLTAMAESFSSDQNAVRKALATIPLRKVARPGDIASAVLFLSSSAVAGHISGQNLVVSGGMEGRKLFAEAELAD